MNEHSTLARRMLLVAAEVEHLTKDVEVSHSGARYKGVSHDQVVKTVRSALIKHGVLALPSVVSVRHTEVESNSGKIQQKTDVEVETTFINADKMDERVSVTTTGTGIDAQDKAPGKAMSYAKKYGLVFAFLLVTGENDEARPEDESYTRREPQRRSQAPTEGPSDRQRNYAWSLIKKLPEAEQQTYIDAMKAAKSGQEASEIIDELKLKQQETNG